MEIPNTPPHLVPDDELDSQQQWAEDYQHEGRAGEAEIIISKQRHGPTDTVRVYFSNQFTKFDNLEPEESYSDEIEL